MSAADGVSADGLTIAGTGIDPQGNTEAWIADLHAAQQVPEPATLPLVGAGVAGAVAWRRSRAHDERRLRS